MELLIIFFVALLLILNIVGVFIPALPDSLFFWIAILLYRFVMPEVYYTVYFWTASILLTVLIFLTDYLANVYFIKKEGGGKDTMLAAAVGLILGIIFMGPVGIVAGPFLLIFVFEYWKSRNRKNSFKLAAGAITAFFAGTAARFILQLILIIWFIIEIT
ncbi:MAG: DUF456 domain-containing protein [Bacillota bacterium]